MKTTSFFRLWKIIRLGSPRVEGNQAWIAQPFVQHSVAANPARVEPAALGKSWRSVVSKDLACAPVALEQLLSSLRWKAWLR